MGKEEILILVARANECLNEAQVLDDAHLYVGSINRSYYSIFNAIQAVLQSADIMVKTHQGAHVQFHQLYEEDSRTTLVLARQFYGAIKKYVDAKS